MTRVGNAWLALIGLTAGTLAIATIASPHLSQALLAVIVFAVAGVKAWLILTCFVGVKRRAGGWRTIFFVYLFVLCGLLATFNALNCGQTGLQCLSGT